MPKSELATPLDSRGDNRGYDAIETGRNAQLFPGISPEPRGLDPRDGAAADLPPAAISIGMQSRLPRIFGQLHRFLGKMPFLCKAL